MNDGDEVALGADPLLPDSDGDGVCDGGNQVGTCTAPGPDNCPNVVNPAQTNSDALPEGDLCQCGDVNNDGPVTAADALMARQHLMGQNPVGFVATRCNVIGPSDAGVSDCNVADIFVIERFLAGESVTVGDLCDAYQ